MGADEMNKILEKAGLPIRTRCGDPLGHSLCPLLDYLIEEVQRLSSEVNALKGQNNG